MKFNEDILKAFNLEAEIVHEPVNVMKIRELLDFMKACAERIDQKSKRYISCDDADVQMDCIDIVTAKLNDFAPMSFSYEGKKEIVINQKNNYLFS